VESCRQCNSVLGGTEKFCSYCGTATGFPEGIFLDTVLPISLEYSEAIKVNVENPSAVTISRADLDFYPYYLFKYALDLERKDPTGKKHHFETQGVKIVDAFNGKLLTTTTKGEPVKINMFRNFLLRRKAEDVELEPDNVKERIQIIIDLLDIEPINSYRIQLRPDYAVNIVDDRVSWTLAEKSVLTKIITENTVQISYNVRKSKDKMERREMEIVPRYRDITFNSKSLVHIPKWTIIMKAGDLSYIRKVLAASNTFIEDEISVCPKHPSSEKIWDRRTFAICEICGGAFCDNHVLRRGYSYFCERH
jgi:RNA polymerase subunit RPABC4/transcription elongation factor Spt4